jgi:uncharacterized protein (DUF1330 family)
LADLLVLGKEVRLPAHADAAQLDNEAALGQLEGRERCTSRSCGTTVQPGEGLYPFGCNSADQAGQASTGDNIDHAAKLRSFEAAAAVFKDLGGRYIMRTDKITALDGTAPKRFVVIAFDSAEKAQAWNNSPAQKDVNAIRVKTTKSRVFIVEGMPQ